jgi:hypothetical protein
VKTSWVPSRSEMRPEYLAEFEAAGIDPRSIAVWGQWANTVEESVTHVAQRRTRKVILSQPTLQPASRDPLGIVGNIFSKFWFLLLLSLSPLVIAVWIVQAVTAVNRGGRRRRRRW